MKLHDIPPLLLWALFDCVPSAALDLYSGITGQQIKMCLSRVAALPKAEGYGTLCTSIEALYREQQSSAGGILALREEGQRVQASNAALEKHNQELNQQIAALQEHQANREKEWQAAAKKFQANVASRDTQWKSTVSRVEAAEEKKVQREEKEFQTARTLGQRLVDRDASWQKQMRRLKSEKEAAEQQVLALQKQEEAMKASTSAESNNKRTILLALSREKQKSYTESKHVQGLLRQIDALQKENVQLVQRCT